MHLTFQVQTGTELGPWQDECEELVSTEQEGGENL